MAAVHSQNFGFGPDSSRQQVEDALYKLEEANAWARVEQALAKGVQYLATANPGLDLRLSLDESDSSQMEVRLMYKQFSSDNIGIMFTISLVGGLQDQDVMNTQTYG